MDNPLALETQGNKLNILPISSHILFSPPFTDAAEAVPSENHHQLEHYRKEAVDEIIFHGAGSATG